MDIQTTEVKTEIPVTITELEVSREVSKLLNNPKPIVPRIDHEWFQAELPPFGNKDATTPSPDQLNLGK